MVVIKLVVKEPSEKRKRRQLLPTPAKVNNKNHQIPLVKSLHASITSPQIILMRLIIFIAQNTFSSYR